MHTSTTGKAAGRSGWPSTRRRRVTSTSSVWRWTGRPRPTRAPRGTTRRRSSTTTPTGRSCSISTRQAPRRRLGASFDELCDVILQGLPEGAMTRPQLEAMDIAKEKEGDMLVLSRHLDVADLVHDAQAIFISRRTKAEGKRIPQGVHLLASDSCMRGNGWKFSLVMSRPRTRCGARRRAAASRRLAHRACVAALAVRCVPSSHSRPGGPHSSRSVQLPHSLSRPSHTQATSGAPPPTCSTPQL